MKRILLATALSFALVGAAAFAQQTQLPEGTPSGNAHHFHQHAPNPQRQAQRISRQLNLSADTTAKLAPIFADRDQKFQTLMQDQSLTPQQRHEQMKTIHQNTQQELASVLTPDQLSQLKTMRRGHRRPGQRGPNGNQTPQQPQNSAGL